MFARLAKLSFPMILASSALACVAPTGDDSLGSGSESLTGYGPLEPTFLLEREGCDAATQAETKLIAQKAVAAALKGADLKHDGNPLPAFDYKHSFPPPGGTPSYPYGDVVCRNGKTLAGAWAETVGGNGITDGVTDRHTKLASMTVTSASEVWGLRATDSGIRTLISYAWADMPKRMNAKGQADPAGDITLSSIALAYPNSGALQINVDGKYDGVFSVTGFHVQLRDALTINANQWLDCKSTHTVTLDTTIDSVLNTIFNVSGDLSNQLGLFLSRGPLCIALDSMEQDTLIPNTGSKVQFVATRTAMSSTNGALVAGNIRIVPRVPTVSMTADDFSIVLEPGDEVPPITFTARTDDLRGPLTYTWTSSGAAFSNKVGNQITALYSIGTGLTTYKTITVKVTDADGASVSQSRTVTFKRLTSPL